MSFEHLEVERAGAVLTCRISNPPRHTLTARGVAELGRLVDEVEGEGGVRALVLTGGGDGVFIAHYEVAELADASERAGAGPGADTEASRPGAPRAATENARDAAGGAPQLHPFHRLLLRLERLPAVTIAALNGSAAGGGCELSLACDFRLMADGDFRLGLPETSVGIIPGAGGTQRLARLLGPARALDLILHGTLLRPGEALELGLVHRLAPAASFSEEVSAFAANLASRAPIALAAAKQAVREGLDAPLERGLAIEQACFDRTMRSKDAAGAMRAWLRGERYEWRGE